ncbi:MAG: glycosyltransferase family 2 protein [Planctomycetota bacterium]
MKPKVTIVTPSYNQGAFLENTILSVLNQDYPNIEYIIIDGGSTDGSVDIIKKYQDRLAYWVSEPDRGQSHAINKGFGHATGEIFNWLNSDDLLMSSSVKIAVHYLTCKPNIGVVYGDRITVDERGNFLELTQVPSYLEKAMHHHLKIPQETTFFRSRYYLEAGGLDENLEYCMDYDFFFKLCKLTQFYHIPFVLGAYRKHGLSKTVVYSNRLKKSGKEEVAKVYFRHHSKNINVPAKRFYRKFNKLRLYIEKKTRPYRREVAGIAGLISQEQKK